jgi:hypothetical protein
VSESVRNRAFAHGLFSLIGTAVMTPSTAAKTNEQVAEINRRIDRLAEKRNYAADVMNQPLLALSYQQDIDKLVQQLEAAE